MTIKKRNFRIIRSILNDNEILYSLDVCNNFFLEPETSPFNKEEELGVSVQYNQSFKNYCVVCQFPKSITLNAGNSTALISVLAGEWKYCTETGDSICPCCGRNQLYAVLSEQNIEQLYKILSDFKMIAMILLSQQYYGVKFAEKSA